MRHGQLKLGKEWGLHASLLYIIPATDSGEGDNYQIIFPVTLFKVPLPPCFGSLHLRHLHTLPVLSSGFLAHLLCLQCLSGDLSCLPSFLHGDPLAIWRRWILGKLITSQAANNHELLLALSPLLSIRQTKYITFSYEINWVSLDFLGMEPEKGIRMHKIYWGSAVQMDL